jgi:hypothetical protein
MWRTVFKHLFKTVLLLILFTIKVQFYLICEYKFKCKFYISSIKYKLWVKNTYCSYKYEHHFTNTWHRVDQQLDPIRISLNGRPIDKEYENSPKCFYRKLFFERKDHKFIILNFTFFKLWITLRVCSPIYLFQWISQLSSIRILNYSF